MLRWTIWQQVLLTSQSSCEPVCGSNRKSMETCKPSCPEKSQQYLCAWNGCGTIVPSQAVDIIRSAVCEFDQVNNVFPIHAQGPCGKISFRSLRFWLPRSLFYCQTGNTCVQQEVDPLTGCLNPPVLWTWGTIKKKTVRVVLVLYGKCHLADACFWYATESVSCCCLQDRNIWDCDGMLSVDDPTYHTIDQGSCIPTCGLPTLSCSFAARFRVPSKFLPSAEPVSAELATDEEGEITGGVQKWWHCHLSWLYTPQDEKKSQSV